jgi:alpha-L-fucosidase 2
MAAGKNQQMKFQSGFNLVLLAVVLSSAPCGMVVAPAAEAAAVKLQVDWPAFMARHDLVWDCLPRDYYEGAFVGNGLLGVIVFRDDQQTNSLRFEIGRTDIYDHRETGSAMYERCRLPIGQALLAPVGKITGAQLRTDLWNAETRGEITTDAGRIQWRCFVPSDDGVIVLEVKTTAGERGTKLSFRPQQGDSPRHTVLKGDKYAYTPNPPFQIRQLNGLDVVVQPLLAGGDYATTWKEMKTDADTRTIFLTVANGIPAGGAAETAVAAVGQAVQRGVSTLERTHREWWHAFYPASFVTLPDARLESFFWIQWYKLASATRADRPVVDLMGPWFKLSRWSAYWQNLNVQLAYFTVLPGNHPELGDRLCRWLADSVPDLISNCPPEFQSDSAALGNPTGLRLVAPVGRQPPYHLIALPWLMQQFYLQYRFTMDDQRLREQIYPLLRRTISPSARWRCRKPGAMRGALKRRFVRQAWRNDQTKNA